MFNVYAYERKLELNKKIEDYKQKFIKDTLHTKRRNKDLAESYRKRVENFIINMMETPVHVNDHENKAVKIRDEDPSRFLGNALFVVKGFKNEKARIEETMARNKMLEFESCNPWNYNFRERHFDKEIQPDMHYKNEARHLATTSTNGSIANSISKAYNDDHDVSGAKTHFKAIQSYSLMIPDSLTRLKPLNKHSQGTGDYAGKNMANQKHDGISGDADGDNHGKTDEGKSVVDNSGTTKHMNQQHGDEDSFSGELAKAGKQTLKLPPIGMSGQNNASTNVLMANEQFNPYQSSKQILQECNVVKKKNKNTSTLRSGEGHLISMPDFHVKEVYGKVFHQDTGTLQ